MVFHFNDTAVLLVDSQLQEQFFQVHCQRPYGISESSPMLHGHNCSLMSVLL